MRMVVVSYVVGSFRPEFCSERSWLTPCLGSAGHFELIVTPVVPI